MVLVSGIHQDSWLSKQTKQQSQHVSIGYQIEESIDLSEQSKGQMETEIEERDGRGGRRGIKNEPSIENKRGINLLTLLTRW